MKLSLGNLHMLWSSYIDRTVIQCSATYLAWGISSYVAINRTFLMKKPIYILAVHNLNIGVLLFHHQSLQTCSKQLRITFIITFQQGVYSKEMYICFCWRYLDHYHVHSSN